MPEYILIAGVNGAGKSTLYYLLNDLQGMPRINLDEIVKGFGDWRNPADVIKAGKIAVRNRNRFFRNRQSFNQETTLCGSSIIYNIKKAKELGYQVTVHYVGVDSADIAKLRVKERVKNGGHDIPDKDIERRYTESFEHLKYIMCECDMIYFYDNTVSFNCFAVYKSGQPMILYQDFPKWFETVRS